MFFFIVLMIASLRACAQSVNSLISCIFASTQQPIRYQAN